MRVGSGTSRNRSARLTEARAQNLLALQEAQGAEKTYQIVRALIEEYDTAFIKRWILGMRLLVKRLVRRALRREAAALLRLTLVEAKAQHLAEQHVLLLERVRGVVWAQDLTNQGAGEDTAALATRVDALEARANRLLAILLFAVAALLLVALVSCAAPDAPLRPLTLVSRDTSVAHVVDATLAPDSVVCLWPIAIEAEGGEASDTARWDWSQYQAVQGAGAESFVLGPHAAASWLRTARLGAGAELRSTVAWADTVPTSLRLALLYRVANGAAQLVDVNVECR